MQPTTPSPQGVVVNFNVEIDASGNLSIFSADAPDVTNIIIADKTLPVTALYDSDTGKGLIELWEPSDAQGDINVQLANTNLTASGGLDLTGAYQTTTKNLVAGLETVLCNSFDCKGAPPFNLASYTTKEEYYRQRDFGRVALATYAHYMFGHVDATTAITNDSQFVESLLSLSAGSGQNEDASARVAAWTKTTAITGNVQTLDGTASTTDANLAIRLVKAIVEKGLDASGNTTVSSVNEPNADIKNASLANIVSQVVGQDASRLMNADNSQRTLNQHMLLRFYGGDVIYLNIKLKTPSVSVGNGQLVLGTALQTMYAQEVSFTLKITLGSEDPNILYSDGARTMVSGYNGTVVGA